MRFQMVISVYPLRLISAQIQIKMWGLPEFLWGEHVDLEVLVSKLQVFFNLRFEHAVFMHGSFLFLPHQSKTEWNQRRSSQWLQHVPKLSLTDIVEVVCTEMEQMAAQNKSAD